MNILFIGDVVGRGGRETVKAMLPDLRREFNAQFAIVNGENSAAGAGLTAGCVRELLAAADVVTSGDHTWDQKGFELEIDRLDRVIRPANFSRSQPGRGWGVFRNPAGGEVAVISLLGKVFMRESACCPFEKVQEILDSLPASVKVRIVDLHAEATSEKIAMANWLAGRVTAVIGTHTHVQTADARIIPPGTAAISDVGMVGADNSVLGRDVAAVIRKFTSGMPVRLPVVESGVFRLDGCVVACDSATGRATAITPFSRKINIG